LNKAAEQAPKDIRVIMTAAVDALDVKDTAVARDWLDRLPKDLGDVGVRIRVLYLRGLVEYLDQNPEEAIGAWKKGLELSGGTDPDLTWRLAAAEFEQGRDAEAKELADQFRRLAGDDSPSLWWLETLQDERAKRYDRAIERLEKMLSKRSNISVNLQEHGLMTLGRCLEKVNLPLKAEKAYREVLEIAPKSLAARLACAQLLCGEKKPEEAAVVLEQGLEFHPKNPTLLVALTSTRLQQQMARPADRRSWTSFDAIYRRASAEARQNPLLDLMLADRLAANNQMDEAVKVLKDGVARDPKSVDFARGLAEYLSRQGQTDQALQVLDRASAPEAVGDRGALRLLRARILNALGRGREARAVLVRDVDKVPEDDRDELWNALVLLCQAHGDPVASRDACAEWARQLPDDVPPKFMRLELAIQANDESEVRRSFAELDPSKKKGGAGEQDNNLWRLAHARVLLWELSRLKEKDAKAGKLLAEAGNLVEAVLAKPQSNLVALLLQGLIREEEGNPKGAIESYKLAWSAGRPEALIRLIDLQTRPDPEDDNHEEELRQLWKSDPTKELDRLVAIACFRNRDREQALRVVRESLGGNPDLAFRVVKESPGEYHEAKTWQAEMFEQLGKFQEAEAVLRKMAEQQPERLERWLALVRHQAAHGGSSAATKTIEDVKLRFKNDRPELLEAQCRTAAGDRPGADKAFEAAIRRYPDDRDVLLYAERYFEGMGRFDRAEACLKRLLERDPNDHPAARQLAILLSGRPESWPQALAVLSPEGPKNDTAEDRLARGVVLVRSADAAQQRRGTDLLTALVADLPADNNVAIMARDVLVRLLLATGQAAQASQVAATSATTGSDPNAVALYVETLIQSGHYDVAEAQIDRLVKLGVSGQSEANLRVRLIQGRSLQERAAPAKSAAALEQAYLARADTAEGEAYGREIFPMLVAMGPDAREVAERLARRLARKSPPLSWMPALIVARQGNRDEALALCRTAAQAGKDPADLREAGRIALEVSVAARLEASALERAGEVLDVALRNSPDFDDLLVMRAMVDHLQSRFDEEAR
ncbi:MAG: hypothetical protein QOE66_496, partial [Chloroflexota bacterium]|nr:hypothetical protein [Chloroflexota bacterium]